MKNKGFTLIELLAVIVILAIIALIAVPIILNIVNDAKESAKERSKELYTKAVQNAIMKAQLDGNKVLDGDYYAGEDGNLYNVFIGEEAHLTGQDADKAPLASQKINIDVEGEFPVGAFIKIKDSQVVASQYSYDEPICTFIEDDRTDEKERYLISTRKGAKYRCKVNDTTTYDFYIVSFNDKDDNGNDNVDLIMANDQLTASSTWGTSVAAGPVTAMNKVMEITNNWTNVPYINFDENYYSNWSKYVNKGASSGYKQLTITDGKVTIKNSSGTDTTLSGKARARLLSHREAESYLKCKVGSSSSNTNTCYSWLTAGHRFWLLDNNSGTSNPEFVSEGYKNIQSNSDMSSAYYIDPVISLPKTAFDWGNKELLG